MSPRKSYRLRFRCSTCDLYLWTVREDVALTLREVYNHHWDFTCPADGPKREKPFQAEEKRIVLNRTRLDSNWLNGAWHIRRHRYLTH